MDRVYNYAPVSVRERADKVVARVKPSLCAAAKTKEVQEVKTTSWNFFMAIFAGFFALWTFFEPAIASILRDIVKRKKEAKGAEKTLYCMVEKTFSAVQPLAVTANEKAIAYGGMPKVAAEKASNAVTWVKSVSDEKVEADKFKEGRIRAKDAISKPRNSLGMAMKTKEFSRFRSTAYSTFLAVISLITAFVELILLPWIEDGIAWAVSTFNRRCGSASGIEVLALRIIHSIWSSMERFSSTATKMAESYSGPGKLHLVQIATAFAIFVAWLRESARKKEPKKEVLVQVSKASTETAPVEIIEPAAEAPTEATINPVETDKTK